MRTNLVRYMVLAASAAFMACGETDLPTDELTEAEAQELAGTVLFATFSATGAGQTPVPAPGGPQLAPFTYQAAIDTDVECPLGGTVAVTADVVVEGDTESEAGAADYSMTQVHSACEVVSENERQFTLWGAPDLALDLLVETNGLGVVEWTGSVVGAVEWATDERAGVCDVALEFEARLEPETSLDYGLAGMVCGLQVSESLTVG